MCVCAVYADFTPLLRNRTKPEDSNGSHRHFPLHRLAKMSGSQVGDLGSGAGKGGGGGGSIREAGGAFGKLEAAREEEYFYKKVSDPENNLFHH